MALVDNLVAYYSMEEASGNAIDAHSTYDLTDNNTVGTATGKVSNARDFERSNSEWFSHADDAAFSRGDTDFTFAFWVQFESLNNFARLFSKTDSGNFEYGLYIRDPSFGGTYDLRWHCSADGTGEGTVLASSSTVSASTWYFLCVWHDSSANQLGLAINAGTADTTSHSTGVYNGTADFRIGRNHDGQYHDGLIDEFGLWGRVLSGAERTELYNSGSGRDYTYISGGGGATTRGIPFGMRGTAFNGGRTLTGVVR